MPFVAELFSSFFDGGYLFSKVIGITCTSYILWLLSSMKILPFTRGAIFLVLGCAFVLIYFVFKGYRRVVPILRETKHALIAEEAMFFAAMLFWSYVRAMRPDIYGLEKYMDFGFVQSILRARYMPPADIWYAGESINYYYFGHYICAFLTRLSGIEASVTYNLMLSLIFSLTFGLTFSLSSNMLYNHGKHPLGLAIASGLVSAVLVTFGGNLHTFIYADALPLARKIGLYHGKLTAYSYPEATRYIGYNPPTNDKTIHEFPIYSFVVSDLHAHVLDIPVVLVFLGVLAVYLFAGKGRGRFVFLFAHLISIMYMTNTWDFIIYITVGFFGFIYVNLLDKGSFGKAFASALSDCVKVLAVVLLQCTPYIENFKNMIGGVGLVSARSPVYQLLVLWGWQILLGAVFILSLAARAAKHRRETGKRPCLAEYKKSDVFALILLISAVGLVMIPEAVYIKDIYGATYQRANTMFKLTYQSFIMFGVSSGYIVCSVLSGIGERAYRAVLAAPLAILLALPLLYPSRAITGYYGKVSTANYKGLDGLRFIEERYGNDYHAIRWLNKNVSGSEVVLEAAGDSYSDCERISMATGLPTVEGWFAHEWLWRGGPAGPQARSEDVAKIYESPDVKASRSLIKKYGVRYIVIGSMEREKYKNLNEGILLQLGKVVFNISGATIIEVTG